MGLAATDSFEVVNTNGPRRSCWDALGTTIVSSCFLSAATRGSMTAFDVDKELVQIKIDNGGNWDHAYYEFA